jgi:DHA3 family macrolide efflux protein-like MFS transporter
MPLIANASFGEGPKMLGFFQSAFGAGVVLMSTILSLSKIANYEKNLLFISISIIGIVYLAIPHFGMMTSPATIPYLSAFFIFGTCIIAAYVSFKTLIQKSINNDFSGRVFAVAGSIGNGSIPAAMIAYGFLFENFGIHKILITSGAILVVLSAVSYFIFQGKLSLIINTIKNAIAKS